MKRLVSCIMGFFILSGCNLYDYENERLYYKYIQTSSITIEWFFYSTLSNTTPDYVVISKKGKIDTLCIADNVIDVSLLFDTIKINFNGFPRKYGKPIDIKYRISEYPILVDTTKINKRLIKRDFFKMNK